MIAITQTTTQDLREICLRLGAKLHVSGQDTGKIPIRGVAPLESAGSGDLSFVARPDYAERARHSGAGAIIVGKIIDGVAAHQIVHPNPYYAFAQAAQLFWTPRHPFRGIEPGAVVHPEARVDASASVGACAWIGPGVSIGARSYVYPGCFLGEGVVVGEDSVLRANVVVEADCRVGNRVLIHAGSVIGADGFGFAPGEHDIAKIPQVGRVVIEDDVEIGGCSTVDRAVMGETRIGRGSKLDSHVHIAHNAQLGQHVLMSGLSGVAGSAKVGDWVMIGGHTGVNGHIEIADRVQIGALTGVVSSITEAGQYIGFPAIDASSWRRRQVYFKRLEDMYERLRALEEKLAVQPNGCSQ